MTRDRLVMTVVLFFVAIFPAAQAQTYTVLYQFKAGDDGTQPYAGVVVDTSRNALFGTTEEDGSYASGTVFKLNKAGESVLHSFTGSAGDGEFPNAVTPTLDSKGNLYGVTGTGGTYGGVCGANGCGVIYKLSQLGTEKILYQFQGGADGNYPQGTLAIDSSGNLYGATGAGGLYGFGTVFELTQTGLVTLYTFDPFGGNDGEAPYGGVTRDSVGNLYGTTIAGGLGNGGVVYKVDPSGKETILYNFGTQAGDGGFSWSGVSLDGQGNLYGTTSNGGANGFGNVFKVTPAGVETVLYNFGPPPDGQSPYYGDGVILDRAGNLYGVTTSGGTSAFGVVYKIDTTGKETILHSFSGPDGKLPVGNLAIDPKGNLYGTTSEGGVYGGGVIFRITP
jgi:uncharacterized repeat protein (TIGR03803 family)